jgi:hypothetical protein
MMKERRVWMRVVVSSGQSQMISQIMTTASETGERYKPETTHYDIDNPTNFSS